MSIKDTSFPINNMFYTQCVRNMSQRSHLISCKCKHLHRLQMKTHFHHGEDSNSAMLTSTIEVLHTLLASFELTKPFGSCHGHILGNHSIRRTCFVCSTTIYQNICSGCYINPSRLNIAMKDQILS